MTDDLPQLVQRLTDGCAFTPSCQYRGVPTPEWCNRCLAATALDTLTRALAEQQAAHRREGNEWVEAMVNTTTEMDRLREALAAMTQERDQALFALSVTRDVAHDYQQQAEKLEGELGTAESALAAAVREARAETWAQAGGGRKQP